MANALNQLLLQKQLVRTQKRPSFPMHQLKLELGRGSVGYKKPVPNFRLVRILS